ncbi:MAG: hypothetical protein R3F59_07090 [Myxococcota bacterium]
MSVFRRLYNVAYGKVRAWQSGDDGPSDLDRELYAARERPVGRRERWSPPETEIDGDDAPADEAEPAAPKPRRL